ncbi:hypothetical protein BD626DRAFT_520094 [Schizophyllum amplum]|uniref:Uncharacterized protein n=1 Tax=Schizophyllum amplum TaxID=97359 RepID=A0A550BUS2_9AGAR|nr:hypothetical protein BD626DRAFT_520094 [Auriculariopsis ampla]
MVRGGNHHWYATSTISDLHLLEAPRHPWRAQSIGACQAPQNIWRTPSFTPLLSRTTLGAHHPWRTTPGAHHLWHATRATPPPPRGILTGRSPPPAPLASEQAGVRCADVPRY